jgi:hypothetical protein
VLAPEAAALEAVAPEAAALVLEVAVRAPEVVAHAAEEPVQAEPVVGLPAPQVAPPRARAEPERVAPPAQAPVWVAAQVVQVRPASAVAQRVSPEAPLEMAPVAPARRVRSVPLPVLPASALPPAVARPVRRGMAPPRRRLARTEGLGVGRGAASWRPLLSRKSPAPTSCVPCISAAIYSRAPRNALRRRTARNCRSTFAADVACLTPRQRTAG